SSAPIQTHHIVEYGYWVRDSTGLEKRMAIPVGLVTREGQSLTFLYAKANTMSRRLIAVVNHSTGAYSAPNAWELVGLLIDPVPDLPELIARSNLTTRYHNTIAIGIFGTRSALSLFAVLMVAGLVVGSMLSLLLAGAAWVPLWWFREKVRR